MRPLVKICGITRLEDAVGCAALGADFLGFIFVPSSRRHVATDVASTIISEVRNADRRVRFVGVFADADGDQMRETARVCDLDIIQMHGYESPELMASLGRPVIKAIDVSGDTRPDLEKHRSADWFLFDSPGRTTRVEGKRFDWRLLPSDVGKPFFVAGGLDPLNVRELMDMIGPAGIDVSSGVESAPGIKNLGLVEKLMGALE